MNTLSDIDEHVWAGCIWAEAPNLTGLILVPSIVVVQELASLLGVLPVGNLLVLDGTGAFITKWRTLAVESVVFVWRF